MQEEVVILSGSRTAIGSFGGSLKSVSPIELGTVVAKKALEISEVDKNEVGQVAFGHVINTEPKDMYLSRVVALNSGLPKSVAAMNVNRLCGSGLQAIVSVIQSLTLGDSNFGLAGGSENMSNSPHILKSNRWGKRMGNTTVEDMMLGALNCPFGTGHMGVTAENVASEYGISREDQDSFSLESQLRASNALEKGYFKNQIVDIKVKKNIFNVDEHPKETDAESLKSLNSVFMENGTVTAGNSSGLNDGAAALVLGTAAAAKSNGLKVKAKILGYSHSGVRPEVMGIGPIIAVKKLLDKTGLSEKDFDVIESNEAFAAQACAVSKELNLNSEKVNPNGGAIALGHPIGASGTRIFVTLIHEMLKRDSKKGLATLCIGGGMGVAMCIERKWNYLNLEKK